MLFAHPQIRKRAPYDRSRVFRITPTRCGSARMVPNLVFSLNLVCPTLGQTRSGEKTTLGPFSAEVVQPLSSDRTRPDRGYTNSAE